MMVQAKCVQKAWDSTHAQLYAPEGGPLPGGLYELDLASPAHRKLVDLKTQMGKFIFQFDRVAANNPLSGLYFCLDCGTRFDTLNLLGTHSRKDHKNTGWKSPVEVSEPESEPEEVIPAPSNRRVRGPIPCKGCGQPFANVYLLVKHKSSCPGRATEVVVPEVIEEVTQETTV